MTDLTLYLMPGASSRVPMNALEEIGVPYREKVINILAGEQKTPAFLAVNPSGMVPALQAGDLVLREIPAILHYLDQTYPRAALLPSSDPPAAAASALVDLVWCSSTIHTMVRQIRMPVRYTTGAPEGVKAHGIEHFPTIVQRIAERVGDGWWYGDQWSIVDVYLQWNYSMAAAGGFDLAPYPALRGHSERVRARPSFQRALRRELAAVERERILLPPGVSL